MRRSRPTFQITRSPLYDRAVQALSSQRVRISLPDTGRQVYPGQSSSPEHGISFPTEDEEKWAWAPLSSLISGTPPPDEPKYGENYVSCHSMNGMCPYISQNYSEEEITRHHNLVLHLGTTNNLSYVQNSQMMIIIRARQLEHEETQLVEQLRLMQELQTTRAALLHSLGR